MRGKNEKKLETLQERIDNFLHRRYNELVERDEVKVDFETWIDLGVKEWYGEDYNQNDIPE